MILSSKWNNKYLSKELELENQEKMDIVEKGNDK